MVVSGVGGLDVYLKIHILFEVGFYGYFININLAENMVFNLKKIEYVLKILKNYYC